MKEYDGTGDELTVGVEKFVNRLKDEELLSE